MSWSYKSPAQRPSQPDEKPPFMILGMDLPLLGFVAIGGGFVLFGVFWLFFTQWPLPRYCGMSRATRPCGWVHRVPAPPPIAPAVNQPSGPRSS
jgi:hypothetical protein